MIGQSLSARRIQRDALRWRKQEAEVRKPRDLEKSLRRLQLLYYPLTMLYSTLTAPFVQHFQQQMMRCFYANDRRCQKQNAILTSSKHHERLLYQPNLSLDANKGNSRSPFRLSRLTRILRLLCLARWVPSWRGICALCCLLSGFSRRPYGRNKRF